MSANLAVLFIIYMVFLPQIFKKWHTEMIFNMFLEQFARIFRFHLDLNWQKLVVIHITWPLKLQIMNENHYSHLQFDKVTKFSFFPQTGYLKSNYLQNFLGQAWYRKVLQPMDIYQEYKNQYHTIKRINTIKIVFNSLMKVKRRLALW